MAEIADGENAIRAFEGERQKAMDDQTDQFFWIEEFKKHKGITKLTRYDVVHLVDRVEVMDARHINVRLRFIDEYERARELLNENASVAARKEAI